MQDLSPCRSIRTRSLLPTRAKGPRRRNLPSISCSHCVLPANVICGKKDFSQFCPLQPIVQSKNRRPLFSLCPNGAMRGLRKRDGALHFIYTPVRKKETMPCAYCSGSRDFSLQLRVLFFLSAVYITEKAILPSGISRMSGDCIGRANRLESEWQRGGPAGLLFSSFHGSFRGDVPKICRFSSTMRR